MDDWSVPKIIHMPNRAAKGSGSDTGEPNPALEALRRQLCREWKAAEGLCLASCPLVASKL